MELIELDPINLELKITVEALQIPQFKKIVDDDVTKDKRDAKKVFSTIAALTNYNSPFAKYSSQDKVTKIKEKFGVTVTPELLNLCKLYKEFRYDPFIEYFNSCMNAASKTKIYLDNVDYSERDSKGKAVYDVKTVIAALKETLTIIDTLKNAEERVKQGMQAKQTVARGQRNVSEREEPSLRNKEVL
jgi:hypothetical protein